MNVCVSVPEIRVQDLGCRVQGSGLLTKVQAQTPPLENPEIERRTLKQQKVLTRINCAHICVFVCVRRNDTVCF